MDGSETKAAAAKAVARDPKRWLILVVLCLSTLVLVVDNMVLTVSVPPIAEDLDASASDLQWILDSYMLVFAGLLLTSGSLSDRFGRRKVMIIGLVLFGAASLLATVAESPEQLIAGRVLMGVGGALIMPSTLSILITVFDEDERGKAMAAWGSAWPSTTRCSWSPASARSSRAARTRTPRPRFCRWSSPPGSGWRSA